jgi:hypothetical protein
MRARLERFTGQTHEVNEIDEPTIERIEEAIRQMGGDWSTTIELSAGKNTMFISASGHDYAVMVNVEDGREFFDLVGEPNAVGEIDFVHGGQLAKHPLRHVAKRAVVVDIASSFIRTGGADLPKDFPWERQQ